MKKGKIKKFIKNNNPVYILKNTINKIIISQKYFKKYEKNKILDYEGNTFEDINKVHLNCKKLIKKCSKIKNELENNKYNDKIIEDTYRNLLNNNFKIALPKKKRKFDFNKSLLCVFNIFFLINFLNTVLSLCYNLISNLFIFKINFLLKRTFIQYHYFLPDDYKKKLLSLLSGLQNVFIPTFIGAVCVYFTVLGIALNSKKNVSFKAYFRFTSTKSFYINVIILFLNFIITIFLFPIKIYSIYFIQYYIINILQIVYCCYFAIKQMSCIQDKAEASKILKNNIIKLTHQTKKNNNNYLIENYLSFLKKCFEDESFEIFMDGLDESSSLQEYTKELTIIYDTLLKLLYFNEEKKKIKNIESTLKFLTHQIIVYLSFTIINYELINYFINTFMQIYITAINDKDLNSYSGKLKSYLILYRDSLYFYSLKYPDNENIKSSFNLILKNSVSIITYSIESNNKSLTKELINNFPFMIQFFKNNPQKYEIVLSGYQDCLVDIIVNTLYLIYKKNKLIKYMPIVSVLIDRIKIVNIYSIDDVYYEEKNPSEDFIKVKYERNFFIILFLIYLKQIFKYEDIFPKIKYVQFSKEDTETSSFMHYSILLSSLENVDENDNYLNIPYFKIYLKQIKQDLEKEIAQAKLQIIKNKSKNIKITTIQKRTEKEIICFKETYKKYANKEDISNPKSKTLISNFAFTANDILDQKHNVIFPICYEKYYDKILLSGWFQMNKIIIKEIHNLTEIPNLDKNEKNYFYCPLNYRTLFRNHNLSNIKYSATGVEIEGYQFNFINMHMSFPGFVLKKDLEQSIALSNITPNYDSIKTEEELDSYEIYYNIPITIEYLFDMAKTLTVYKLV